MPVDLYVGGAEHAVLHLLYARFWHKVLYDLGLVHTVEPFQKLVNQGMILGASYRYFDDNIGDDPNVSSRRYSFREVEASGEGSVASSRRSPGEGALRAERSGAAQRRRRLPTRCASPASNSKK